MAVQSTYQENLDAARAGLLAGSDFNADTGICETAAGIGFGLAVGQGAADKGVVLGGALAIFRGIAVRDVALGAEVEKYPQYANVGVITRGKVWVLVAADVAPNDPVHYVSATGAFTNTGDIGPILGARYVTSAVSGGLAQVELSGYNPN
jgi:hypothetical protein